MPISSAAVRHTHPKSANKPTQ